MSISLTRLKPLYIMTEDSETWRGDLMRRMAAISAEIDLLADAELPGDQRIKRTKELRQQLAELTKKLLAS